MVIVGAGFGGPAAAKALCRRPVRVTLLDRNNYHVFQPLLYQVAAATLSATEIAAPVRHIFRSQANLECLMAEVAGVELDQRRLRLGDGRSLDYDFLVLATGSSHSYFGHADWARHAPGLKTLEDALEIRRRFLLAFERAEREEDPALRRELLTFVVVGGGATGVELAGTLKEMARLVLPREFRRISGEQARVVLVEGGPAILPAFGEGLSERALDSLRGIGVEVVLGRNVSGVDDRGVQLGQERIPSRTVLWAAGVAASPLGRTLGAALDRAGPGGCRWGRTWPCPGIRRFSSSAIWRCSPKVPCAGGHPAGPGRRPGDPGHPGRPGPGALPVPGPGQHGHHRPGQGHRPAGPEAPERHTRLAGLAVHPSHAAGRLPEPDPGPGGMDPGLPDHPASEPPDSGALPVIGTPERPGGCRLIPCPERLRNA